MVSTHVLKTYRGTPSRGSLTFMWLCHTFVSLKFKIFLLFAYISSYFILITFPISALLLSSVSSLFIQTS